MGKEELKCQTCANSVSGSHCTRFLTMKVKSRDYKKCEGYKKYIPPPPKVIVPKKIEITDYDQLGTFGRFLKNGGGYSFRTKEFIGVTNVKEENNE